MTTTATPTLVDFLLARIAEDEEAARAATRAEDVFVASYHGDTAAEYALGLAESEGADQRVVQHYARHDPVRVLAECAAKRAILERCRGLMLDDGDPAPSVYDVEAHLDGLAYDVLTVLAQSYASHPDFRAEWLA